MNRPAYSWDGAEPAAAEVHFQQLLDILRRRRAMIIATAVVGTTLVFVGSLMIPPRYTAKAQIVFENQAIYASDGRPAIAQPDEAAALQTHMAALTSRTHLKRALDSLSQDADFRAAALPAPSGAKSIGEALWLGFGAPLRDWAPRLVASRTPEGQSPTEAEALRLERFERRLNVFQEHGSHVIAVAFSSTSPSQAVLAANRLAQLYIASEDQRKRARAEGVLSGLGERIPAAKGELEEAETALQNYRSAHSLADPNRTDLSDQKLADLTRQLTAAESDLAKRQAKLASVRDLQRRGTDVEGLVKNLDSPAHAELLGHEVAVLQSQADIAGTLGEKHPKAQQLAAELQEVRRKLSNEVDLAIDRLKNDVRIASDQVASIRERLAGLQAASGQAQVAEPRLRELEREATAAGQVYEGLLQRREQLRADQKVTLPDLRILSLASPPDRPSSYSPLLFILPSLIIFSIGGGLVAVTAERLDQGLRSDQDVNVALGIPCIGLVPLIRRRGRARPHEYLLDNPFTAYAEAIRSVVAALQLAAPEVASKVILISSSVPKEGKTTLAVSVAVYASLIGRRALLVDFDFRHPGVSRELGGQPEMGVPEAFLLDDRAAAGAVQHIPGLDLDYLPMHSLPDDPLRPFVSGHVPRLLGQLRDSYDCVVIDSPPLLAVAEARLLTAMADKVLLVVKWGSTRQAMARDASNLLRDLGLLNANRAGLVGAVLTQIDLKKYAQYRYGDRRSLRALRGLPPRTPSQRAEAASTGVPDLPSLKGVDTPGERPPPAQAVPERLSSPPFHLNRLVRRLSIGILVGVAVAGVLFVSGDSLLLLVHRAEQQIAAFGAWVKPSSDKARPTIAGNAVSAEAIAAQAVVERQVPTMAGTGSVPAVAEDRAREEGAPRASLAAVEPPKRVAADDSSTKEAAPPRAMPIDVIDATVTLAPGPTPPLSTSTPSAAAAKPPADILEPTSTAAKAATALTGPPLSAADIAALVARGDALVGVRDIVSARLFYQRAVEAGDGRAALRMGATFDPAFLDRANIRGVSGNQQETLSWYRRARALGEAKAEGLLKALQTQ